MVADVVTKKEALYTNEIIDTEGNVQRAVIDLQPIVNSGVLSVISSEDEDEIELFIQLATGIDDGEAMTGAIAISRRMTMATDDRKGRRFLRECAPEIDLITTPEIVKHWVENSRAKEAEVRAVIGRIRDGANFTIQRGHPLTDWWSTYS
jgi:hypothetical protein